MEEEETVAILSRKELRKQKLMEYLAAKGKLKIPNPPNHYKMPHLREDVQSKTAAMSTLKVVVKEKENKASTEKHQHNVAPRQHPPRRAFGVANQVNTKNNTLTTKQESARPPSALGRAQSKYNVNHVITNTYAVVTSKSHLNAASHLKKQLDTGIQASGKVPSSGAPKVGTKSTGKFSCSSNAAFPRPATQVSVRMSLGPVVKTRTGLIPAVTHPKSTKSNVTLTSATAAVTTSATTLVATKVRSVNLASVSVSQRSALSSTARAGNKFEVQKNSKSLPGKNPQPPEKKQSSSALKSASCAAVSLKPEGRATTNKRVGRPAVRSTNPRTVTEAEKNAQRCTVNSQASSRPETRCRSVSGNVRDVGAGRKAETSKETVKKKESGSANAPPPQAGVKRTRAPAISSQTAPQPARTVCLTGRAAGVKTPKVQVKVIPQTEGKKLNAAQEERLRKLQEWRAAKGISYKRPPMPVKPPVQRTASVPQPFWTSMKEEDEAHSLICAVDRSLADCIKLLGEGCPSEQVRGVLSRLPPVSQKFAKYWICRARLMEKEGDLDVLPMFEEAVRVVLEPVDELRTVVFDILKKKGNVQASEDNETEDGHSPGAEDPSDQMTTPKPSRALIWAERGDSSVVKYRITATPGGHPSQKKEPGRVNGQEVRFFTPVRRSARIERASLRYPAALQDHDLCVTSYSDLISEEGGERRSEETSPPANDAAVYVYRENEALQDKMFVKLVWDEDEGEGGGV
ncbi:cytoskeleton-associated protein 2-like [Mugil cephalus]|uniref:cytoskeleton-associated protein 2-like n=1 Tax=Mugil cephalus TaxID=48193 RepID=UPI001FB781D2|nr:cytoskeleton-associated protein 2-like [Mugil cephalus]